MKDPGELLIRIKILTGVLEVGLFCGMCKAAYFGGEDGSISIKCVLLAVKNLLESIILTYFPSQDRGRPGPRGHHIRCRADATNGVVWAHDPRLDALKAAPNAERQRLFMSHDDLQTLEKVKCCNIAVPSCIL